MKEGWERGNKERGEKLKKSHLKTFLFLSKVMKRLHRPFENNLELRIYIEFMLQETA
jgi:hypothetical protein